MTNFENPSKTPKTENTKSQKYDRFSVLIHWFTALAVGGLAYVGYTMIRMDPSMAQFNQYQLHKSFGITVLSLTILRLIWRKYHVAPSPPAWLTNRDKKLAIITKHLMMTLLIISPLLGWMMVSVSPLNLPTVLFETIQLPHFPVRHLFDDLKETESLFKKLHLGANMLLGLSVLLHIAGGIKHTLKDDKSFLSRMLP